MQIGYARVSTEDQNLSLQLDALKQVGCQRIYKEKISSRVAQRPALSLLLDQLRMRDTIVAWRLDGLDRSLKALIDLMNYLTTKQAHFKSLNENIDTGTPTDLLTFHLFCALKDKNSENFYVCLCSHVWGKSTPILHL